jgi:hypothetical protein
MIYLIPGTIIGLAGLGLIGYSRCFDSGTCTLLSLAGIIVFLIGGAIALKGRRSLDKNRH